MSRYTPEFNAYARRVVKSFNQRVMRAEKRGLKNLPSLRSVRDLKAQFTTEDDLKKELASLRQFNESRDALKTKMLGNEAKITNWEFNYIRDNLEDLKQYYDRELKRARKRYKNEQFDFALHEDVLNLEQTRDYLNRNLLELSKSELSTFRKYLNKYKNRNRTDQNFYDYYFEAFDFLGRVSGVPKDELNHIKEKINSLTPEQFYEFYKGHSEMKNILDYVPSEERAEYYSKMRDFEKQQKEEWLKKHTNEDNEVYDKVHQVYLNIDKWTKQAKQIVKS